MPTATRERPSPWRGALERLTAAARAAEERADVLLGRVEALAAPFRDPPPVPSPYCADDPEVRRRLRIHALAGTIGSGLAVLGASLPSSPFTEKVPPHDPAYTPPWFFGGTQSPPTVIIGLHTPPGTSFYVALVSFYGGLILLMGSWIRLARLAREHPDLPLRTLAVVMALWTLPMLFVEPLLSKDAYSYVAQGEMMSYHISPYRYGPEILGMGANSYTILSDKLWWYSVSPYGPGFLALGGVIQDVVGHSELGALVLWRLVALVGVALIAVSIPRLTRSIGRPVAPAFVFAVMNPIVVIHLIGGEHNDALMLGLMLAGLALARERHPALGCVLVAMATMVKVPAAVGAIYIGWDWIGDGRHSLRERLPGLVKAGAVSLVVVATVTQAVGIGWGWITGLTNPDAVRSYLDPMTAVGLGLGKLAHALGHGGVAQLMLTIARGTGAAAAIAIGLVLLFRSTGGASSLRALGLTMLAVVLLGPVMQPWYLAWSVVLLAPVVERRLRGAILWLTVLVTFLALGDEQYLATELLIANPFVVAAASLGLLGLLVAPLVPKVHRGLAALRAGRTGDEAAFKEAAL
jgi:alpha-1,6-mannosyltransferase